MSVEYFIINRKRGKGLWLFDNKGNIMMGREAIRSFLVDAYWPMDEDESIEFTSEHHIPRDCDDDAMKRFNLDREDKKTMMPDMVVTIPINKEDSE